MIPSLHFIFELGKVSGVFVVRGEWCFSIDRKCKRKRKECKGQNIIGPEVGL